MKPYRMKLVLGDWSNDGHGQSEEIVIVANHSVEDVQQAYKDSCKLTGVSFNHNKDYTEVKRDYDEAEKYRIATEYEDNCVSPEVVEILSKYEGFDKFGMTDEYFSLDEIFSDLWFWFVKLSLSDLEYEIVEDTVPVINGYWNKNLNVQFGYGLFS